LIESQIRYISQCLRLLEKHRAAELDVRPEAQREFNREIQGKLAKGVWTQGGCQSWYLDAQGVNRSVWPGFTWRYWQRTKRVRAEDYVLLSDLRARTRTTTTVTTKTPNAARTTAKSFPGDMSGQK
jgi:hypothetical protein